MVVCVVGEGVLVQGLEVTFIWKIKSQHFNKKQFTFSSICNIKFFN